MSESLTYLQLLEALTQLVNSKASGTMFIRSQCNHAISFYLDSGRISALHYGPRRGDKAISLIGKIAGGSYRFATSSPGRLGQDLSSTAEILGRLKTSQDTAEVPASTPLSVGTNPAISTEQKQRIYQELKQLLTGHLGPIAELVFDDVADETGDFWSSPERTHLLNDRLAIDIGDPVEIEQFHQETHRTIIRILGR